MGVEEPRSMCRNTAVLASDYTYITVGSHSVKTPERQNLPLRKRKPSIEGGFDLRVGFTSQMRYPGQSLPAAGNDKAIQDQADEHREIDNGVAGVPGAEIERHRCNRDDLGWDACRGNGQKAKAQVHENEQHAESNDRYDEHVTVFRWRQTNWNRPNEGVDDGCDPVSP